jgi:hypothetical protein
MGVRIMGFALERVGWGRVVAVGQRQNMAADHFLMEIQQFAHQFCGGYEKKPDAPARMWHANCFKVLKNPHPIALFDFTPS